MITAFLGLFLVSVKAEPKKELDPGQITGVVRFTGEVPQAKTITVTDGTTIKHNDLMVDAKTKGLRYVMVMLEDAPAQPKLKEAKPVVMDQRDWLFVPRVIGVQYGRPVRFDNNDAVNHSVMANSLVKENQLNSVAGPGTPITHVFERQKNPVLIGCSLHPWMRAWIYVVEHPWFAVADTEGKFRIEKVPPGKYNLLLVHPDTNHRERRPIEVQPNKTLELAVEWKKVE